MRNVETLYEQISAIESKYKDTSFIPKLANGLMLDADKEKYADILAHNDAVFQEQRLFNAGMTKAEKKALSAYRRSLRYSNI